MGKDYRKACAEDIGKIRDKVMADAELPMSLLKGMRRSLYRCGFRGPAADPGIFYYCCHGGGRIGLKTDS